MSRPIICRARGAWLSFAGHVVHGTHRYNRGSAWWRHLTTTSRIRLIGWTSISCKFYVGRLFSCVNLSTYEIKSNHLWFVSVSLIMIMYLPQPNNWSARHWENMIVCSTSLIIFNHLDRFTCVVIASTHYCTLLTKVRHRLFHGNNFLLRNILTFDYLF